MPGQMWTIAGAVLNTPAVFYPALAVVLLCKWTVWFPAILVQYGLYGALDAALTDRAPRAPFPPLAGVDAHAPPDGMLTH